MSLLDIFWKRRNNNDYPSYLQFGNYGTPKWSTQKDEQYIREGFNKIVWIYTCATLISSNVSKVRWELWRIGKGRNTKDTQIYYHPLLDIVNKKINSHFSAKDFFELWALGLALQGKFYAQMNSPVYPTQLYCLYPHKVRPIPSKKGFVSGFEYDIGNEKEIMKENEVLWSKFNDPLDYYEGLSPIKACARTVDTENSAVDWNKSALQNNGVPPGAIQVENPSPELQNTLRKEWKKKYAGPSNARTPIILNSGKANYIPFGLSQVDMDYINLKLNNRIEICSVFKIPPQVAGDTSSQTFANYEQASKALWEQCIIPEYLDRMKDDINLYLAMRYADNLEFRYNLDDISVLHEDAESKMRRATEGYTKGILKRNEARFIADHDEVEGGDEFIATPVKDDGKEKEEEKDKKKINFKAVNMNDEEKEKFWRKQDKEKEEYIKGVQKLLEKSFDNERKKVIKNINNYEKIIESLSSEKQKILIALYKLTIQDFGEQTYNRLSKIKADDKFVIDELMEEYINTQTATQIKEINETTISQVQQRIQLAQDEGMSIPQITKFVDDLYLEQIIPNRSELIARTETISSSNYGSLAGAKQAENDFDISVKKIWIATFDSRVRPTHARAGEHKPIKLDEYFTVGRGKLKFPADFNGPVEEVARCRCAVGYVSDD